MPQAVITRREQPLLRIGDRRLGRGEALTILLRRPGRRERAYRQLPCIVGDDPLQHEHRAEKELPMLFDDTGHDDLVAETVIERVRRLAQRGPDSIQHDQH